MRRITSVCLLVAALALLAACRRPPTRIAPAESEVPPTVAAHDLHYTFDFVAAEPRIDVTLTLRGEHDGDTELLLPSAWAGEEQLYRSIANLRATSPAGGVTIDEPEPSRRVLHHPPDAALEVTYALVHDAPPGEVREYRPIVETARFHFIGLAAMVRPDWPLERVVRARLEFDTMPESGVVAHSFAANTRVHEVETELGRVLHAIYVGGDFRVDVQLVDDAQIAVAVTGDWSFSDAEFGDIVTRIVAEERRFWRDRSDPYFLITLLQTGTRCCGYGGTGLSNGYATFVSTDGPIDLRLKRLIAHEMFHTWNGRKIPREDPEEAIAWFSEGFTDYYARLLLLRAGVITLEEYVAEYNAALEALYRSPVRNADNDAIVVGLWKSPLVEKLPYHRGDALAHQLNREIRRVTSEDASLDTVMRGLLELAVEHGESVSTNTVVREVEALAGADVASDLRAVVDGRLPDMHPDALGPCVELTWARVPSIELGFDPSAVAEGRVEGVEPGSDAHAKGIRDGQRLVDLVVPRRVDQEARVVVADPGGDGVEAAMSVDVRGPLVDVPVYRLRPGADSTDERCLAWFGE